MKRHVLKARRTRSEEVEGHHGRTSFDNYFTVTCETCGKELQPESLCDPRGRLIYMEYEHNLDEIFLILEQLVGEA